MSRAPHPPGFTLLEVMIAVSIIGIALTVLLGSQSQSLSLAKEARFYTTASLLAQSEMAHLVLAGDDGLVDDSGDFGDDFPEYYWQVRVSGVNPQEIEGLDDYLKLVELDVFWGESERLRYSLRFLQALSGEK